MSNGEELSLLPCPFCGRAPLVRYPDSPSHMMEIGCPDNWYGGKSGVCNAGPAVDGMTYAETAALWNRRSSPSAVEAAEVMGPTYYTEGKDAEWFEALDNAEFAKRLSFAAMDIVDGDFSSIENYMPIVAMLSSAADRLGAAKLATDTEVERTWVFDPSGLWISTVQSDAYSFVELTKQKASDRDVTLTIHRGDEDTARWTDLSIELHEHNAKRLAALLCASPPPASPSAPQGVEVPEGWVLVPREPTTTMVDAAWWNGPLVEQIDKTRMESKRAKLIYAAMLAAAPAIQTSPEAGR